MVISIVSLVRSQKLKILIPAALSFMLYSISLLVNQIESEIFVPGYSFFPACDPKLFNIKSFLAFYSYLVYLLTMIPFLMFYRFHIMATNYLLLIFCRILNQINFTRYWCFFITPEDERDENYIKEKNALEDKMEKVELCTNILDSLAILFLVIEIVYQMYRRRMACFK